MMTLFYRLLPVGAVLALSACGGGSGGSSGGSPPGSGLRVVSPMDGAVLNVDRPRAQIEFLEPGIDPATLEVRVDGQAIPSLAVWTVLPSGASGYLPTLGDGAHQLSASARTGHGTLHSGTATFQVSTGGGQTVLSGLLLDPEGDTGIEGAVVFLEEDPSLLAVTDAAGRYSLQGVRSGAALHLVFDPTDLQFADPQGPYAYPRYKRPVDVLDGATTVADPCYLPKIRPAVTFAELMAQGVFDCTTQQFMQDFVLENPVYPELCPGGVCISLTIPAGTYVEFLPGAAPCDQQYLSIAPVDKAKAPSNLPEGVDPALLVTVQPTGMTFHESPGGPLAALPITFPNIDGLAPGNELTLFSVDHATGEFVPKGRMLVDPADPARIITIEGGLEGGSWHCSCPPDLPGQPFLDTEVDSCNLVATNPTVDPQSGLVRESWAFPPRILLDEPFALGLVHDSGALVDELMARLDLTIPTVAAVPGQISLSATLDGLSAGPPLWFDTQAFPEDADTPLSIGFPLDVSSLPSGIYRYRLDAKSVFFTSSATTSTVGCLPVRRIPDGPFGRGWSLAGDDRVFVGQSGDMLVAEGDGDLRVFERVPLPASGLRMRLYDDWSDAAMQSFFTGLSPSPFTMFSPNGASQTVTEVPIPNVDFATTAADWILHAGLDGTPETSLPAQPVGDDISILVAGGSDTFGGLLEGFLVIPFDDSVVFQVSVDDACVLEVDGQIVLQVLGINGNGSATSTPIPLTAGAVPFRVAFNDKFAHFGLRLFATGAGYSGPGVLPAQAFSQSTNVAHASKLKGTAGDFSTVKLLADGTYERAYPDGALDLFDPAGRITERRDRRGRLVQYVRDPVDGRLLELIDPVGGCTTFSYQAGHVHAVTDPAGRTTTFQYSGVDLVRITDPDLAEWEYAYDPSSGFLISTADPDDRVNVHEYDARGRFVRTVYPDGTERSVISATATLYQSQTGATSAATAPVPPQPSSIVGCFTNEVGVQAEFNRSMGGPGEVISSMLSPLDATSARITTRRLDVGTRLPNEESVYEGSLQGSPQLVAQTSYTWDHDRGLLLEERRHALGTPGLIDRLTQYVWDAQRAWLLGIVEAVGDPQLERTTTFGRDAVGNLTSIAPPAPAGSTTFSYDPSLQHALASVVDPTGVTTTFERLHSTLTTTSVTSGGIPTARGLDPTGFVRQEIAADGATTTWARDSRGRPHSVQDALGAVTTYRRHPSGMLESVQDAKTPPGIHRLLYDARGRLETWLDALGRAEVRSYYDDGSLKRLTRRGGSVVDYLRDSAGRVRSVEYRQDPSAAVADAVTAIDYGSLDRPAKISDESTAVLMTWSPFGELVREAQHLVSQPIATVDIGHDTLGRRTGVSASLGSSTLLVVQNGYDLADRLITMVSTTQGWQGSYGFQYDAAGRRTRLTRPGVLITDYVHNPISGLVQRVETHMAGTVLARDILQRNAVEDIVHIDELRSLLSPAAVSIDFAYDQNRRLEGSTSPQVPALNQTYLPYDQVGNRRADTWQYDLADQLLGDDRFDYAYDPNGNLTLRRDRSGALPDRTFEYDVRGHMTRVVDGATETMAYAYDGLGRRVYVRVATTDLRFIYDGEDVIATSWNNLIGQVVTHGPGVDEPLAVTDLTAPTPFTLQAIFDALGSIVQWNDGTNPVLELRYDAFGGTADGLQAFNPSLLVTYAFQGRELDVKTELYYHRARYRDPLTGRFLAREPLLLGFLGSDQILDLHSYKYAGSSPLRWGDPNGLLRIPRDPKRWLDILTNPSLGPLCNVLESGLEGYITKPVNGRFPQWVYDGAAVAIGLAATSFVVLLVPAELVFVAGSVGFIAGAAGASWLIGFEY